MSGTNPAPHTGPTENSGDGGGEPVRRRDAVYFERERGVTDVRVLPGVAHLIVSVAANGDGDKGGGGEAERRLAVLEALARATVPVFLAKIGPETLSFAVRSEAVEACEAVLGRASATYTIRRDLGLVTVHAGAMRDLTGVMAIIYDALVGENISLEQTGDAYNAVLCLVAGGQKDADRAARVLRRRFTLEENEAARLVSAPIVEGGAAS